MKYFFGFLLFLFSFLGFSQNAHPLIAEDSLAQTQWVDSIYQKMNLEEKIGQLFMVDLFPEKKQSIDYVKSLIKNYHVGGVIFFKGHPTEQANLTNQFQKISQTPLLMGLDGEWGLAMRLDSTYAFPWNMTLGAIDDNTLIEKTGAQIARHAKRIGLQFDFAPSVDVNINPKNPIIGNRSFGENPKRVAEKGIAFVKGMQSEGILTTAKHFPGHGDTDVDSHKALPVLNFDKERLDSVEFYPYYQMIPKGLTGIMVSHLHVPVYDNRTHKPATLSKPIITGILKNRMNFKGLIVTDALNMKGVSANTDPSTVSLEAFLAGNDILLYPLNVPQSIKKIKEAYESGKISESRLAHSVKKILMAKYKTGLQQIKPVQTDLLYEDLNSPENDLLYAELIENAITLIKNNKGIIPVSNLKNKKIAYVALGNDKGNTFFKYLNKYIKVDHIIANGSADLIDKLKSYDDVIIGFHKSNASPWTSYHFSEADKNKIHEISLKHNTILSVFTSPYALSDLRSTTNLDAILVAYQNSDLAQEKAAQIIFGALGAKGRLPVSVNSEFPEGTRYLTQPINRLAYDYPENVGMSSFILNKIDSVAQVAIQKKMTPGMQVLVARKGKVVFQKNYGYQTYDQKQPVTDESVYDLASVTKIIGTLPLLMELEEKKEIDLNTKLKEILPFLANSNKANITLKEALSHYARIKAWIPFYKSTLNEQGNPADKYYSTHNNPPFSVSVAQNLYMRNDYKDSIYELIAQSDLYKEKKYRYSDLIFYLMKNYLEDYYHQDLNQLTQEHFYKDMGLSRLTYLPLLNLEAENIVPSEKDTYFRKQILKGYVDDEGAAMLGGIGGHAGLFGNANDVAKVMQMYLNGGVYGNTRFLKPETIRKFNTCYYCKEEVRRGIGFDKPQLKGPGPGIERNSKSSFGHTGFTGTMVWVDPEKDLVYVCLTNRTYPDRENNKLIKEDIRTKIEEIIYDAIIL